MDAEKIADIRRRIVDRTYTDDAFDSDMLQAINALEKERAERDLLKYDNKLRCAEVLNLAADRDDFRNRANKLESKIKVARLLVDEAKGLDARSEPYDYPADHMRDILNQIAKTLDA